MSFAQPDPSQRFRLAAAMLILGVTVSRLLYLTYLCPLDLAPDEAYYWDWSRQLDWCYHSKGPLVAWLIRASCTLLGDTVLGVRLPAVVCGSLTLAGLFVFTAQTQRSDKLAFLVIVLASVMPMVAAGAMLMTIDAPFICAWTWALVFAHRAALQGSCWSWYATGTCIFLGILAKHTMVLWIPSFALFLAMTPALRGLLFQRGLWIMIGIGSLGALPIVLWNAVHGWPTLSHTQFHAGLDGDGGISWIGPLRYLGTQFGLLLGFWFIAWVRALWAHRPTVETSLEHRYLWWMSVPTFVFFGLFAWKNGGGEPNWPLTAYVSGMVLAAGWLRHEWQHGAPWSRQLVRFGAGAAAVAGMLITATLHEPMMVQPVLMRLAGPATSDQPTPIRRVDPTTRLRGWRFLAGEVDHIRADLLRQGIDPILAADRWSQVGELGFYCDGQPNVYCLGIQLDDRLSQYDVWHPNPVADPSAFAGKTFVVVGLDLHRLQPAFARCEDIRTVTYSENGHPIRTWTILIGHGFRGWH